MATNGPDPRLEQLENTLRGVTAAGAMPVAAPADANELTYDLAKRVSDTAKAMRDLADYSNHVAGDIERIVASYITNMHRLMGKAGPFDKSSG